MKKYNVYFEIYGKKMKATVEAENQDSAREMIRSKIDFHKVQEVYETKFKSDESTNNFNRIVKIFQDFIKGY